MAITAGMLVALAATGSHARPPAAQVAAPDAAAWWSAQEAEPKERFDPLGGRRLGTHEVPTPIDNGVEASLYRLWGLQPLQSQLVRRGEMILEVWIRPSRTVRQAVIRITVRADGRAFVQARAGLACCTPQIARRVNIDAELPHGSAARLAPLAALPLWDTPRTVTVDDGGGAIEGLCVNGVAYDLSLVTAGHARHLRRACDPEEIGQAADPLAAALGAAMGHDPRFDVLFAAGAGFEAERAAYRDLVARGGRLKAAPQPAAAAASGAPAPP